MLDLFPEEDLILTVSELTSQIKDILESGFPRVWVLGEISSVTKAGSGHVYLTLKDAGAIIRCVIWKSAAFKMRFPLEEGLEIVGRGRLSVYLPRGDYQMVLEEVEPRGMGAHDLILRKLKEKLARAGYFAPERKKRLPRFPRRIALITSPTGAAIRDMLEILGRRWPVAEVWVCPVRVQGPLAAEEIAAALRRCNRASGIDTVILGRGGGSNEDLSAFNHEAVAKAIFESKIPVISAVGHEVDVTIADLVADRRALTPSEAAEIAVPDRIELFKHLQSRAHRLHDLARSRVDAVLRKLRDFANRRAFRQPVDNLRERERRLDEWQERLGRALAHRLQKARHKTDALNSHLQSLSPLNVLARGYSLTRIHDKVVRDAAEVKIGDEVESLVERGRLLSRVEKIIPAQDEA